MITDNELENIDLKDIQEKEAYNNDSETSSQSDENRELGAGVASGELTVEEESFKSQFLRLSADFANYKRRTEREREELVSFAQGSIIEKFLPFLDDLGRAFDAAEKSGQENIEGWLEGFRLVEKNLKKQLEALGLEEIEATAEFNPEFHEALMNVESDTVETGNIVQVLSKGYRFRGKVLRHAKVSVAQ